MREVAQVWYTHWKDNRSVESGPIEWEEFKKSFLGMYFPHERREANVGEFVNFRHGYVDVEESKLRRSTRNLKRAKPSEQNQPKYNKRAPNQDGTSATRGKLERGGGSQLLTLLVLLVGRSMLGSI